MFSSLVITLREGIEGALAVAIVLLYLRKTGRQVLASAVWWGLGTALLASLAGAYLLQLVSISGEIVEGTLMIVAAFFVGTLIVWMWRSAKGLKKEIEDKIEEIAAAREGGKGTPLMALFLFTFFMIFREGIETVIFLSAVNLTTSSLLNFIGGLIGLLLAVLFGIFFVRGAIRIDLGRFFKITGIVLLLFVFQLLIGGVHELGEGGLFNVGPREMSLIGPIVKNNALFLIGVLLIPFLMLVIPPRQRKDPATSSAAERRLLISQQRRQRLWRLGAATLSLFVVLFIAYDFVYGQNKKKMSTPIPVSDTNGEINIPVDQVSDGRLHRFLFAGSRIRFIVMKLDDGRIGTAYDACQICGTQGYIEQAGTLICLNCDADINKTTFDAGGGCNPIPLLSRIEGGMLKIRVQDLKQEGHRFEQ